MIEEGENVTFFPFTFTTHYDYPMLNMNVKFLLLQLPSSVRDWTKKKFLSSPNRSPHTHIMYLQDPSLTLT